MLRSICCLALIAGTCTPAVAATDLALKKIEGRKPRNVVFVLVDDHRYDAMGCMGHPFVETPNMDRLARDGVLCENAFVTTSLCSPSRASIITGLYAHNHRVINNNEPVSDKLVFFPQYLQKAGYQTAFVGKWHMGHGGDGPQRGFDYWVSFRGQGSYYPRKAGLNVNGKRVPQKGYITDELTDYALDWLKKGRDHEKPFFLYVSHKAVHGNFEPAKRHDGKYKNKKMPVPKTQPKPDAKQGWPRWVQDQRNSWHGIDFPYHGQLGDKLEGIYQKYCESLLAVDENVGRLLEYLEDEKLLDSTLVVYMGDNGFAWGEHGLIDKRTAYEESMRVPLLLHCPELFKGDSKLKQVVANIDIAPTVLEAAGLEAPKHMDGRSFLPLAEGKNIPWRDALLYEYFWERNYPHTPTMHALRTDQYKYIHYYGVWDVDELFDIKADPFESKNLINSPEHKKVVAQLNGRLFDILEETNGMSIPLYRDRGGVSNKRNADGQKAADFPIDLIMPGKK